MTFDKDFRAWGRGGYQAVSLLYLLLLVARVWADVFVGLRALAKEKPIGASVSGGLHILGEGTREPRVVDTIRRA